MMRDLWIDSRALVAVIILSGGPALAQESRPADPIRDTVTRAVVWLARQTVRVEGVPDAVMFQETQESTAEPKAGIYGGTAGVLIFLENAAAVLNDDRARRLADATAKGLLAVRQDRDGAPTWTRGSRPPNASLYLGDAGIGQAFLVRARLLDHAIRDGGLCWPAIDGTTRCLGGWCHGPPGTARLFLLLHAQTGDPRYLDAAISSARWVMSYARAAESRGGKPARLPPSFCCGVAGALDFFCDLYRVTGNQEFADFAVRAGDYLIQAAERDGDGVRWLNGASLHANTAQQHGIDLMLGASGEGLALLRLATLREKPDPIYYLPDRAVE